MGACQFWQEANGKTPKEAFDNAVRHACWEHGHGGYTGTIAEKHSFVVIPAPADQDPRGFAEGLLQNGDARIDDKWGPAGCVQVGPDEFLFFGWASS